MSVNQKKKTLHKFTTLTPQMKYHVEGYNLEKST